MAETKVAKAFLSLKKNKLFFFSFQFELIVKTIIIAVMVIVAVVLIIKIINPRILSDQNNFKQNQVKSKGNSNTQKQSPGGVL